MYCKNCGKEMNAEQIVCLECGVKKGDGNKFCPNCGKTVNPEQIVCLECGVGLKNNIVQNNNSSLLNNDGLPDGKDRLTAALLAFFLGGIGIHNFYLGETKKGIVKIVCLFLFGLSGILALIDFVKLLIGSYKYDPNALI